VVGQPQTHHIVRYENLYKIARDYDLGFWELARFQRAWIISICPGTPISPSPPVDHTGKPRVRRLLINVAELAGYRFFPDRHEVYTYPIASGFEFKTPSQRFGAEQGGRPRLAHPPGPQAKYGMS